MTYQYLSAQERHDNIMGNVAYILQHGFVMNKDYSAVVNLSDENDIVEISTLSMWTLKELREFLGY